MASIGAVCYRYRTVGSTNDVASGLAARGAPEGTLVVAAEQTGGRGRFARPWVSPPGGLWFSVLLRPDVPPARVPELAFVGAVGVARGVRAYPGVAAGIKWPNDLVYNRRKLGGILVEAGGPAKARWVIMGVGLNVNVVPGDLPPVATSLCEILGRQVVLERVLEAVTGELETAYRGWLERGFAPVLTAWREFCSCLGLPVTVRTANAVWHGVALDVDAGGALLLAVGDRTQRVLAGEVLFGE
ncbi:MAG: biotin--[acetyl-CoA-carboxylase] ligase [Desulfotomaculales bacterium]